MKMNKPRCHWVSDDPLYIDYHDKEWGVPLFDDQKLFELLVLEGMQAGLSWISILKKRENFKASFDDFDAIKIANYQQKKINSLLNNAGIIRNRLKIESTITNSQAYLDVINKNESFSDYLWQFVEGKPIQNHWQGAQEIPAKTPLSETMSKELKKAGFKFVGPTICYAFMQAVGMVNDHITDCFRYAELKNLKT